MSTAEVLSETRPPRAAGLPVKSRTQTGITWAPSIILPLITIVPGTKLRPLGFHVAACRGDLCRLQMADMGGSSRNRPSRRELETQCRLPSGVARHECTRILRCDRQASTDLSKRLVTGE